MTSDQSAANPAPKILPLAIFTAAYLLAAVGGAITTRNGEFVFYIVVMLILVAIIWTVHSQVTFSTGVLWALSIWGLLHMAGGLVPVPESWPINGNIRVLYSWWIIPDRLKYDQVVHAYGFATTTWACWQALSTAVANRTNLIRSAVAPSLGFLVLCAAAGMGFGALNEVVEFAAYLAVEETNVGGYDNTGWDLVSNLTGCIVSAVLIRLRVLT